MSIHDSWVYKQEWDYGITVELGVLHFGNCQTVSPSGCATHIPIDSVWEFQLLHVPANTYYFPFLIIATLVGIKWYLIVVPSIFKFPEHLNTNRVLTNSSISC